MPKECCDQHIIENINPLHEPGSHRHKVNENNMRNLDWNFAGGNGRGQVEGGNFLLQDLKSHKFAEEDVKSKSRNHKRKNDLARERWKILAKALLKPKRNCSKSAKDVSVRRFTSFDLVTPNKLGEYPVTDYWVSQERKFCEFCKCSISANKASIEFHENGKNHKENVAKRLLEIQKKAAKDAKDAENFDTELKRMEAAALRAYMKDIETNPDFTSHTIGKITIPDVPEPPKKPTPGPAKHKPKKPPPDRPTKKWMEAVSDDGQTYYWNVDTGESVWEPPEVGFMSLAEQKNPKPPKPSGGGPSKFKKKFSKKNKPGGGKGKEGAGKGKGKEEEKKPLPEFIPIPQGHPYGKWEKVEVKKEEPIDLQLPEQEFVKVAVPGLKDDSERRFKEKKIPAPGSIVSTSGETGFKKRKFSSDPKRNMRQRLDDD